MRLPRLSQLLITSLLLALVFPSQTILAQKPCSSDCVFRFVVYGDTRNDKDSNDEGDRIQAGIVAEVIKYKPALVLQTGDLVENAGKLNQWAKFDQIIAPLKANGIAYFPARGNHDNNSNREYEKRVKEPFRPGGNSLFYAFDRGNVRFIAIDTETELKPGKPGKPGSPQYEWLRNELANAKTEHQFIVPFFHKAIYSVGKHGSDKDLRKVIESLFSGAGARLVFQGHDHIYYHTKRDGIVYVVAGGGGAPLYDLKKLGEAISGDKYQKANNFLVCDVYPDRIDVTTYISHKPLEGEVYVQFDQFTVAMTP